MLAGIIKCLAQFNTANCITIKSTRLKSIRSMSVMYLAVRRKHAAYRLLLVSRLVFFFACFSNQFLIAGKMKAYTKYVYTTDVVELWICRQKVSYTKHIRARPLVQQSANIPNACDYHLNYAWKIDSDIVRNFIMTACVRPSPIFLLLLLASLRDPHWHPVLVSVVVVVCCNAIGQTFE